MSRYLRFTQPVYLGEPLPDPLPVELVEVDDEAESRAYAAFFEQWARPAIALEPLPPETPQPLGSSRLGGCPDLAPGEDWPSGQGRPFSFLAQVNLAEAAPHDPRHELPPAGLLSFFADISGEPLAQTAPRLRVLYHEPGAELLRRPYPEELPAAARLAGQGMRLSPCRIPPDDNDLGEEAMDSLWRALPQGDHLRYLQERDAWSGGWRPHLLGWPERSEYSEDMRYTCEEDTRARARGFHWVIDYLRSGEADEDDIYRASRDWLPLAQLALPGGRRLAVWIRQQDLAARACERAWGIIHD